jgi:hypothetical protein
MSLLGGTTEESDGYDSDDPCKGCHFNKTLLQNWISLCPLKRECKEYQKILMQKDADWKTNCADFLEPNVHLNDIMLNSFIVRLIKQKINFLLDCFGTVLHF